MYRWQGGLDRRLLILLLCGSGLVVRSALVEHDVPVLKKGQDTAETVPEGHELGQRIQGRMAEEVAQAIREEEEGNGFGWYDELELAEFSDGDVEAAGHVGDGEGDWMKSCRGRAGTPVVLSAIDGRDEESDGDESTGLDMRGLVARGTEPHGAPPVLHSILVHEGHGHHGHQHGHVHMGPVMTSDSVHDEEDAASQATAQHNREKLFLAAEHGSAEFFAELWGHYALPVDYDGDADVGPKGLTLLRAAVMGNMPSIVDAVLRASGVVVLVRVREEEEEDDVAVIRRRARGDADKDWDPFEYLPLPLSVDDSSDLPRDWSSTVSSEWTCDWERARDWERTRDCSSTVSSEWTRDWERTRDCSSTVSSESARDCSSESARDNTTHTPSPQSTRSTRSSQSPRTHHCPSPIIIAPSSGAAGPVLAVVPGDAPSHSRGHRLLVLTQALLQASAALGRTDIVRWLLLGCGARDQPLPGTALAAPALAHAVLAGHCTVVDALLAHGAIDPDFPVAGAPGLGPYRGPTLLFHAIHDNNAPMCLLLLRHGASLTVCHPRTGDTPLHYVLGLRLFPLFKAILFHHLPQAAPAFDIPNAAGLSVRSLARTFR